MPKKVQRGAKAAPKQTAAKSVRAKPRSLTRKRPATAAYRRELKARTNDSVMADIEARIEAASRIRDQITAKIERGLAEDRSFSR